MIAISETDLKRLIAMSKARRFPGQLDLIRSRVRKIARQGREIRERVNFFVWLGRHIKWCAWDIKLEGLKTDGLVVGV